MMSDGIDGAAVEEDDDAALVRASLGGRVEAFGLLYDRYAPLVRAVCFDSTRDLSQAQDLGQETFLRAFRKLTKLRNAEVFAPWLIGIARQVCREWRRSAGRRRGHLQRASDLGEARQDGEPDDAEDELKELRDAIATLPKREREALHLFYLNEQPADAAAKVLGLSRSGFYRSLDRARNRVRRILGLRKIGGVTP